MPVMFANPMERGQQIALAKDMIRLRNNDTGEWLHTSGTGTTKSLAWSWLGFSYQAAALRAEHKARGQDWPFTPVHRKILESEVTTNE